MVQASDAIFFVLERRSGYACISKIAGFLKALFASPFSGFLADRYALWRRFLVFASIFFASSSDFSIMY